VKRNINTIILLDGNSDLSGLDITCDHEEDAIKVMADGCVVNDNIITDNTRSRLPHRDAIQLIPRIKNQTNAQFFGATQRDVIIANNTITSNGSLQGVFASDGLFENLVIENNNIQTQSAHEITIGGLLSGEILNNNATVKLYPLRIGGSHPQSFYVSSFAGGIEYQPISGLDTNTNFEDKRFDGRGVDDFNLMLFREIASVANYTGFSSTFNDVIETYKSFSRKKMTGKRSDGRKLSRVVASHEGGRRSFNRGRSGDAGRAKLTEGTTIATVLKAGEKKFGSKGRIWAVGRYQFIPPTLKLAIKDGVVSEDEIITSGTVQDRLFYWAITKKRHQVADYIKGDGTLNNAMLALSKEWASLPNPYTGRSYYNKNGIDKAHTPIYKVRDALKSAKRSYSNGKSVYESVIE